MYEQKAKSTHRIKTFDHITVSGKSAKNEVKMSQHKPRTKSLKTPCKMIYHDKVPQNILCAMNIKV